MYNVNVRGVAFFWQRLPTSLVIYGPRTRRLEVLLLNSRLLREYGPCTGHPLLRYKSILQAFVDKVTNTILKLINKLSTRFDLQSHRPGGLLGRLARLRPRRGSRDQVQRPLPGARRHQPRRPHGPDQREAEVRVPVPVLRDPFRRPRDLGGAVSKLLWRVHQG